MTPISCPVPRWPRRPRKPRRRPRTRSRQNWRGRPPSGRPRPTLPARPADKTGDIAAGAPPPAHPAKKSGRDAREGLVSSYIHTGGRVGVLIEVNCETDFVARTDEFQKLVRDLAVQVAGLAPLYVDADGIPAADLERRKAELAADESVAAKPAEIREKIVDGQLKKWFREVCLLDQPFRDEERSVRDLVTERISTIGENIRVRRFVRYALGEDL